MCPLADAEGAAPEAIDIPVVRWHVACPTGAEDFAATIEGTTTGLGADNFGAAKKGCVEEFGAEAFGGEGFGL